MRSAARHAAPRPATFAAAMEANAAAMRQKIQIGKKQLRLADDDYRAILARITGKDSSTKCGPSDLEAVLREFARLGWKPARGTKPLSKRAQIRMIYAVWKDIEPMLAVGGPDALRSFVQRQTRDETHPDGISAPEFLDAAQANKVVEGLKAWRARLAKARREAL